MVSRFLYWLKRNSVPFLVGSKSLTCLYVAGTITKIPLAVDSLTPSKFKLTFDRVCVQIDKDSTLLNEISIKVMGKNIPLKILYDLKPTKCTICNSFSHPMNQCHLNPNQLKMLLAIEGGVSVENLDHREEIWSLNSYTPKF